MVLPRYRDCLRRPLSSPQGRHTENEQKYLHNAVSPRPTQHLLYFSLSSPPSVSSVLLKPRSQCLNLFSGFV